MGIPLFSVCSTWHISTVNMVNTLFYTMYIDYLYCMFCSLLNFSMIRASSCLSNDPCAKGAQHSKSHSSKLHLLHLLPLLTILCWIVVIWYHHGTRVFNGDVHWLEHRIASLIPHPPPQIFLVVLALDGLGSLILGLHHTSCTMHRFHRHSLLTSRIRQGVHQPPLTITTAWVALFLFSRRKLPLSEKFDQF